MKLDLNYSEFSIIRALIIKSRHEIANKIIIDFLGKNKYKKLNIDKLKDLLKIQLDDRNPFTDIGQLGNILDKIDILEEELQEKI